MALNAVLAYRMLKRTTDVRLEYPPVHNILVASATMGLFVGVYRPMVPLSGIWLTPVPDLPVWQLIPLFQQCRLHNRVVTEYAFF